MKQVLGFLFTIIVAAAVAWSVVHFSPGPAAQTQASTQPVYDRVMASKTLRCGYVVYPPTIIKDPNTGAISGLMHDVIESAAAKIGIKVEWTEEFNWGNYLTGLQYDHVDMICAAAWNNHAGEWTGVETIGPLFYSGIGVWVRKDDDRFIGHLEKINDPSITISAIDGTVPGHIAASDYPQAKVFSMPQVTDYSFNLVNVADKKADVTFVENFQGYAFAEKNPGVLKNIAADNPIRVFPNVYVVRKGEQKLKNTFDDILRYMMNSGETEKIIAQYEKYPGSFYRVAKPYQMPEK